MAIAIAVILGLVGIFVLWYGHKIWQSLTTGAPRGEPADEIIELPTPRGSLAPDETVFLFAEQFVGTVSAEGPSHTTGTAPLSQQPVSLRDQANRLIYAVLVDQYQQERLQFRIVTRDPTMMPPFPHKAWELQVQRSDALSSSPLLDCLNVSFNVIYKQRGVGSAEQDSEKLWISLDELLEHILRVARAEISFWKREGVYGDLCNYIEEALVARGYLHELPRRTWLERMRNRELQVNRDAIQQHETAAEELHQRLTEFRQTHGSEQTRQLADDLTQLDEEANQELAAWTDPLDELPLDDALRMSIYEALVSLRQLEPSGGGR